MVNRPYTFDRVVRILFALVGIVAGIYLINLISNALLPFLVAWLLAYLLNPFVNFIQNGLRVKNRALSVILALVGVVLGFGLMLLAIVEPIRIQSAHLVEAIAVLERAGDNGFLPSKILEFFKEHINFSLITKALTFDDFKSILNETIPRLWSLMTNTFSMLTGVLASFVTLLYLVFILIDYEKISKEWINLIPVKYRSIVSMVASDVIHGMNSYFRGQALVSFIMGILFSIGFSIIGLPFAIPLGMFTGLLNMVPYLQLVGIFPLALLSFLKAFSSDHSFLSVFLLGILVLCIAQIIQDIYLVPKIMGKVTGLNPAVILLSLSIWGTLLGILGLILALPLTTLLLSYYRLFILKGEFMYDHQSIKGPHDPSPE